MDLSIFFAGTGGSIPTARRGLPAVLLRRGGDRILFDCGEGTQRQLVGSVGLVELDAVFLTHFHADHWLGLPGMLKTFELRGRERPLAIYGPPGLRDLLTLALRVAGRVRYDLELYELATGDVIEHDGYRIAPVPVAHRLPAFGYAVFEDDRPGVFDPEAAVRLGLTPGPEFGRVQRGETINGVTPEQVMGPARAGRKIVISGDTAPSDALRVAADRADVLVHEATFAEEERDRAAETGHSTAGQAATLAREAAVVAARADPLLDPLPCEPPARRGEGDLFADRPGAGLRHHRGAVRRARTAGTGAVGGSCAVRRPRRGCAGDR